MELEMDMAVTSLLVAPPGAGRSARLRAALIDPEIKGRGLMQEKIKEGE